MTTHDHLVSLFQLVQESLANQHSRVTACKSLAHAISDAFPFLSASEHREFASMCGGVDESQTRWEAQFGGTADHEKIMIFVKRLNTTEPGWCVHLNGNNVIVSQDPKIKTTD